MKKYNYLAEYQKAQPQTGNIKYRLPYGIQRAQVPMVVSKKN